MCSECAFAEAEHETAVRFGNTPEQRQKKADDEAHYKKVQAAFIKIRSELPTLAPRITSKIPTAIELTGRNKLKRYRVWVIPLRHVDCKVGYVAWYGMTYLGADTSIYCGTESKNEIAYNISGAIGTVALEKVLDLLR